MGRSACSVASDSAAIGDAPCPAGTALELDFVVRCMELPPDSMPPPALLSTAMA